jgi:hypothetical protein
VLGHRHRFAGQRGLGRGQCDLVDQPRIGADRVAGSQKQDVAGHQVARRNGLFAAVAQHPHLQARQPAQRGHRSLSTPLLVSADQSIRQYHPQDHGRVAEVAHASGKCRGDEQDVDQRALELAQQEQEYRAFGRFG